MVVQRQQRTRPVRQNCPFCKNGTEPYFGDVGTLEGFVSDRGRITGRKRSGVCAKHQRRTAQAVKRARFLALLPFSEKIIP